MTPLVPLMLLGWAPFTIFLFFRYQPHRATLISVIGGTLFLPMTGYDISGLPSFTKESAIAFGLILGGRLSGHRQAVHFRIRRYDLPMLIWCVCPIASSLSNGLGFYDGLSGFFTTTTIWGVPYFAGRVYFHDLTELKDLCVAIVIGGMLYLPLCLYEIRMSPQLSNIFYGFFPHNFSQHIRYGGFRPIVFMQHGIMVALWMAISTTVAYWLWRSKEKTCIFGIPLSIIVVALMITTILCKTAVGWLALLIGCGSFSFYKKRGSTFLFQLLLLAVPLYIIIRLTGIIEGQDITTFATHVFDESRVRSLEYRLDAEILYSNKAFEHPLLGWGGYARNRVIDPETGSIIKKAIDSFWLIAFSAKGLVGLVSFLVGLLIGPWLLLRFVSKRIMEYDLSFYIPIVLSLCVILFMIDSLLNGMLNPVYVLISGTLVSYIYNLTEIDKGREFTKKG